MSTPRVSDELLAKVVVDRGGGLSFSGTYPSEIANISPVTWALDLRDARETVRLLKEELAEARRLLKAMQPAQPTDLRLPGVLKLNKGVRE